MPGVVEALVPRTTAAWRKDAIHTPPDRAISFDAIPRFFYEASTVSKSFVKVVLILLMMATAAVSCGRAAAFKLPEDRSAISLVIPDAWKPELIDRGVQGQTPDGDMYLSAEITKTVGDMNAIMDGTDAMLKEHKVKLDRTSAKENKYDLNGLKADELAYQAKDEKGPALVSITFVNLKDMVLVVTRWTSPEGAKAHQKEFIAIMQSIKVIK